jgi:hypothetical protein
VRRTERESGLIISQTVEGAQSRRYLTIRCQDRTSLIKDELADPSFPSGFVQWRMAHAGDLVGASLLLCTRLSGDAC